MGRIYVWNSGIHLQWVISRAVSFNQAQMKLMKAERLWDATKGYDVLEGYCIPTMSEAVSMAKRIANEGEKVLVKEE